MAIKSFKEIVNNKGYRISSKDRAIFEEGNMQSFFGFTNNDFIEFIVYDANDNQLPQGESGELVRYISLSTQNINDYILLPEGTYFQAFSFPKEYFIDVERLLREAGYNNGIFKIQITLLNKRVGFESPNEKLWVKQISPSRTEIKLLPLRNEVADKTDLLQRFNVMFSGADFRDDMIQYIPEFINKINPSIIDNFILNTYGRSFFDELVEEFSITGFDSLTTKIYNKFVEAFKYEFTNRVSKIRDANYGKPKKTRPSLKITKKTIEGIAERILVECIEFYLPQRVIQSKTQYDEFYDASFDKVGTVLQRKDSDRFIQPKPPIVKRKIIKKEVAEVTELEIKIVKEIPKEIPVPIFVKPKPRPLPPKPLPTLPPPVKPKPLPPKPIPPKPPKPIPIIPRPPKPVPKTEPKPKPKPIVIPKPYIPPKPIVIPTPPRTRGGGAGSVSIEEIRELPSRNQKPRPGSGFDNADGLRTKRNERLL